VCAGVIRDQAELERLVFLGDEGWRTDLNKTLLDEDLEIFPARQGGACHHPYGVLRPYLQARVESITVEYSDWHLGVDLDRPGVGFSGAASHVGDTEGLCTFLGGVGREGAMSALCSW